MKPIWEQVKELEESNKDADRVIGECRATMIVNYGPTGKTIENLVAEPDGLLQMIVGVFRYYLNRDKLWREMEEFVRNHTAPDHSRRAKDLLTKIDALREGR